MNTKGLNKTSLQAISLALHKLRDHKVTRKGPTKGAFGKKLASDRKKNERKKRNMK